MSTAAQVEAAWKTNVFDSATIQSITSNAFPYELSDESEFEAAKRFEDTEINFFQYLVARGQEHAASVALAGNSVLYRYRVQITYIREADTSGENWTAVRDAFDTLWGVYATGLGSTWASTVDGAAPQSGQPQIERATLDNRPIWRGTYEFTGFKYSTI